MYGEVIDTSIYSKALEEQEKQFTADEQEQNGGAMDRGGAPLPEKVATKTVEERMNLHVKCAVKYIDYEGRVDARDIKFILQHVLPRKLVLVHGNSKGKQALRDYVEENAVLKKVCTDVQLPINGQCVDMTADTNIFRLNLKESVGGQLEWRKVKDHEIAFIEGEVVIAPRLFFVRRNIVVLWLELVFFSCTGFFS